MATTEKAGVDALHRLKSTEPPLWLAPNAELSEVARTASKHLFSSLKPFSPKSPFDHLLVDGFDAEQIWQQIDIQSQPLLSSLRREVKRFEKNPEEISKLKKVLEGEKKVVEERSEGLEGSDGFDEDLDDFDEEEDEDEDEEDGEDREGKGNRKESEEEGESEDERDEDELSDAAGIEDEFLKIKELEDYLKEDEAREYGFKEQDKKKKKGKEKRYNQEEDEEEGEEDEEDEDDDDELGMFANEDDNETARYEDFYGSKKKKDPKRKSKLKDESEEDLGIDDEQDDDDESMGDEQDDDDESMGDEQDDDDESMGDEQDDDTFQNQKKDNLSSHEKQLAKLKSKVEQMEKANLEPKTWTMQGEVTAARRPKNSALEVDLDFEHNVRPAPVITEEVTESLEDLIQKRILEGRFDDVQRASKLPTKAPRELKELDENKSKKGLAEVYEDEFVRKTDPASVPLSFSDEQKKEASLLFKKLCVKLDALSHFHFTPKPIIDDMSIQTNVPALAMEEIAPLAVSDAAMLAPEEVFGGKGDIKEESELTQADRKRRRAKKKRKHKADKVKKIAKKARGSALTNNDEVKEE